MTYNVQKNWKGKILRIWITLIRHGGLGHEVWSETVVGLDF